MVSVCLPWCPLATPTVLLGFLLPWTWGISSRLLQQSTATAPYLGWGVSPHHRPFWPSMWDSSSGPFCACAAAARWTWGRSSRRPPLASDVGALGSSSRPPPLTLDLGSSSRPFLRRRSLALSAATPDLGRGVTPLGRRPWGIGSSRLLPLTLDVG